MTGAMFIDIIIGFFIILDAIVTQVIWYKISITVVGCVIIFGHTMKILFPDRSYYFLIKNNEIIITQEIDTI